MSAVVFDIGGTTMRVGWASHGKLSPRVMLCPTPRTWSATKKKLLQTAQQLHPGQKPSQVIGGFPGVISQDRRRLAAVPMRPRWVTEPIVADLARLFHAPAVIENDAVLAGISEARHGAGRGYRVVAYLTFGTGVGGARIVDGQLPVVHQGFEPGHYRLPGGKTFSQLVGGDALQRQYGARWPKGSPAIWGSITETMATGIVTTILFWAPEMVVIGGSVALKGHVFWPRLRQAVKKKLVVVPRVPPIVRAQNGDLAGLIGAVAYAASLAKKR